MGVFGAFKSRNMCWTWFMLIYLKPCFISTVPFLCFHFWTVRFHELIYHCNTRPCSQARFSVCPRNIPTYVYIPTLCSLRPWRPHRTNGNGLQNKSFNNAIYHKPLTWLSAYCRCLLQSIIQPKGQQQDTGEWDITQHSTVDLSKQFSAHCEKKDIFVFVWWQILRIFAQAIKILEQWSNPTGHMQRPVIKRRFLKLHQEIENYTGFFEVLGAELETAGQVTLFLSYF